MKWLERWLLQLGFRAAFPVTFAEEGGGGNEDENDDENDDEDEDAGGGEPKDVEGFKKALDAERAARAAAEKVAKTNGRAIKDLTKEIERIKASSATDEEKKSNEVRAEAAKAEREKLSKPLKRAAVKAAAAGRLANPSAALRLVDLEEIEIDDDGEIDEDTVTKAIDALLEEMPELKAKGAGKSGADTSNGKDGGKGEPDMNDLLRRAVTGSK